MKVFKLKKILLISEILYNEEERPAPNKQLGDVVGLVYWGKENSKEIKRTQLYENKKGRYFQVERKKMYLKYFEDCQEVTND